MQIEENNYKKDAISDLERKKHELEKLIVFFIYFYKIYLFFLKKLRKNMKMKSQY